MKIKVDEYLEKYEHLISDKERFYWESYLLDNSIPFRKLNRDALYVSWKSNAINEFNSKKKYPLTKHMNNVLVEILKGNIAHNKTTSKGLYTRGLINEKGQLSDRGFAYIINQLDLDLQSQLLGIPIKKIHLPSVISPEETTVNYLNNQGIKAFFTENLITTIIGILLIDRIALVSKKFHKRVYSWDLTYYPEIFYFIKMDFLCRPINLIDIYQSNLSLFLKYFEEYLDLFDLRFKINQITEIVTNSSNEFLDSIIKISLLDPFVHNFLGWPDLLFFNEFEQGFIEVKTSDKLHMSQILSFKDILDFSSIPLFIYQLKCL